MLLFYCVIFITGKFEIYQMSVPIFKEYYHNKSRYYLPLMVKAKTKTSLSILPAKREKFQNCIDQTEQCFAFLQENKT